MEWWRWWSLVPVLKVPAAVQALCWGLVWVLAVGSSLHPGHQKPPPAAIQMLSARTSLGSSSHQRHGCGHHLLLCHLEHAVSNIYVFKDPVIMSVIHHCQNPPGSIWRYWLGSQRDTVEILNKEHNLDKLF